MSKPERSTSLAESRDEMCAWPSAGGTGPAGARAVVATSCSPSASRRCTTPPTEARSAQSTSRRAAVSRPLTKRGTPPERSTATQRVHGPSWSASGSHSSAATQTHSQTCEFRGSLLDYSPTCGFSLLDDSYPALSKSEFQKSVVYLQVKKLQYMEQISII